MNNNQFEVKEKRSNFIFKGVIFLVAALISLFVALLPYQFEKFAEYGLYFYIFGGLCFIVSAVLFVLHLFKECKPDTVLILTENGFTDKFNTGTVEIEWTNVSTVKLLGSKDSPYLGIVLENNDIVIEAVKPKYAEAIRDNLEENLPAILIEQKSVRIALSELKEIITKYVREARAVGSETVTKVKTNPFSTEDVLRAFGKVTSPSSEQNNALTDEPIKQNNADEDLSLKSDIENSDSDTKDYNADNNINDNDDTALNDSFFEALKSLVPPTTPIDNDVEDIKIYEAAQEKDDDNFSLPNIENDIFFTVSSTADKSADSQTADTEEAQSEITDDEISNEISELLSRSKSAKIAEIEKILNEKDLPYSYSRTEKKDSTSDDTSTSDNGSTADLNNTNEPVPLFEQTDTKPVDAHTFESALDEMIKAALNDKSSSAKPKICSQSEEYPDLIILNDENGSPIKSDDDTEFIIPDTTDY